MIRKILFSLSDTDLRIKPPCPARGVAPRTMKIGWLGLEPIFALNPQGPKPRGRKPVGGSRWYWLQ
jgi:hypothetical protein